MSDLSSTNTSSQRPQRPFARWLLLGGLLLLLLAIGQKGWRLFQLTRQFQDHRAYLATIQSGGLAAIEPEALVNRVHLIREDTLDLQAELKPFLPLTPYLGWLPKVGPLMPHAEELLAMANEASYLADSLTPGFAPALPVLQGEGSLQAKLPELLLILDQNEAALRAAEPVIEQLVERLERFKQDPQALAALPDEVERPLRAADPLLAEASHLVPLATILPELAGSDFPKTYLLVAQNQDELRATGGFISGVGVISIAGGQLGEIAFQDAYAIDDFTKPYDLPPRPIEQIQGIQLLVFRDANYWPDFPTSATRLMDLFTYGTDIPVDGVIAIDQSFLADLVKALEPIQVEGYGEPLSGQNVDQFLREAWELGDPEDENWFATRKSFLGPVANALLDRLLTTPEEIDLLPFSQMLLDNINSGHLMVYSRYTPLNGPLTDVGLTRPLRPQPGQDFLMVVDTNVGFNKVNAVIQKSVAYDVTLLPDGRGLANVTISYRNNATPAAEPCQQSVNNYKSGENLYDALINECYWNYARVLVPAGSALISGSAHPHPPEALITGVGWPGQPQADPAESTGVNTLSNLLAVPRAATADIQFSYQLTDIAGPATESGQSYELQVVKQPGEPPFPLTVTVTLPDGSTFLGANVEPAAINGAQVTFNLQIDQDFYLKLQYE